MGCITVELLRKRSEHNNCVISTLREVDLHQQGIEKIELLGHACRHLVILFLQGNVIGRMEKLHRLKELQHLNLAVNNLTKVQNLQGCESLQKLDLTVNFIPKAGLLSLHSLQSNSQLHELHLLGNPCAEWQHYRPYVVALLPQLCRLDGKAISPSERIQARQAWHQLHEQLCQELRAAGVDIEAAAHAEDDSLADAEEIPETGSQTSRYVSCQRLVRNKMMHWHIADNGEMVRPWCPATRLLDHREAEALNAKAEAAKKAGMTDSRFSESTVPLRNDFPALEVGKQALQCNEGRWDFSLQEEANGSAVVLEVEVGRFLDSSLIKADVQPRLVRLLIKGRLLQLRLPLEVQSGQSRAQRSAASQRLVITMPAVIQQPQAVDITCLRPGSKAVQTRTLNMTKKGTHKLPATVTLHTLDCEDPPPI